MLHHELYAPFYSISVHTVHIKVNIKGVLSPKIGNNATVCDYVISVSYRDDIEGSPTFINLGADYPDESRCQVIVWGDNLDYLESEIGPLDQFESSELGYAIAVTGDITEYDGVAQIELTSPDQIEVVDPENYSE